MTQTKIFDKHASKLRSFTFDEMKEQLHQDSEWIKDDSYIQSCIRDRIKRRFIVFNTTTNKYDFSEELSLKKKTTSSLYADSNRAIALSLPEFGWSCADFKKEFDEEYKRFLIKYKFDDKFILTSTASVLLNKILDNAFQAATARTFFERNANWSTSSSTASSLEKAAKAFLQHGIASYRGTNYRDWHKNACLELIRIYSGVKVIGAPSKIAWKYGNSQKIINLAVKYVILIAMRLSIINPAHNFYKDFGQYFLKKIHEIDMTVDRKIIAAIILWNIKKGTKIWLPTIKVTPRTKYYKPWSTWDEDDYDAYVVTAFKYLTCPIPFVWETIMWPLAKKLHLDHH